MKLKVAVTGATGFVGTWLCALLERLGHDVRPIGRTGSAPFDFAGANAVVHLAALVHRRGATHQSFERANVELSEAVARAAAAARARLVFASTVKVHGDEAIGPLTESAALAPIGEYARSKAAAERALHAIPALDLVVLRPPLVYGPGVKANFLLLIKSIAAGLPLPLHSVSNCRSLLYVGNLADAIVRCIVDPRAGGRTYLVSDGVPLSTPQLCRALGAALGRPAHLFPFPARWLPRPLRASLYVDDGALRSELAWRAPVTLEEALAATARWYRSR